MIGLGIALMERGWLPDRLVRGGIRRLCAARLDGLSSRSAADEDSYAEVLRGLPVAVETKAANDQHYELPPEFFQRVLGKNLKYSGCHWPDGCASLDEAEKLALEATIERAELRDRQAVLELGCGWGSLTLFMAARFPNSRITAISNSAPQRSFIEARARERGLSNVTVLTRNVSDLEAFPGGPYDRAVSVEMFEHMKNYETLLARVSRALTPGGKLFVHVFAHRSWSYPFQTEGEDNWLGRHFFTGGQMPGRDLLPRFQKDLRLERQWWWDGTHYAKTAEAWLANHDRHRKEIQEIFRKVYGDDRCVSDRIEDRNNDHGGDRLGKNAGALAANRWRIFWMACAELFNFNNGQEWGVAHYLFGK